MLIGLCGPEGAGKTTAGRILAATFVLPVCPFAGPLKRMIEALGVDPRHLYGSQADKAEPLALFGGRPARHAMQTLGTEWGRQCIGPDFWIQAWAATLPSGGAVVDDIRFPNEAEAITSRGGFVIQVLRSRRDTGRRPGHASEDFAAVPFQYQVVNDRCPTILKDRLMSACMDFQSAAGRVRAAAPLC